MAEQAVGALEHAGKRAQEERKPRMVPRRQRPQQRRSGPPHRTHARTHARTQPSTHISLSLSLYARACVRRTGEIFGRARAPGRRRGGTCRPARRQRHGPGPPVHSPYTCPRAGSGAARGHARRPVPSGTLWSRDRVRTVHRRTSRPTRPAPAGCGERCRPAAPLGQHRRHPLHLARSQPRRQRPRPPCVVGTGVRGRRLLRSGHRGSSEKSKNRYPKNRCKDGRDVGGAVCGAASAVVADRGGAVARRGRALVRLWRLCCRAQAGCCFSVGQGAGTPAPAAQERSERPALTDSCTQGVLAGRPFVDEIFRQLACTYVARGLCPGVSSGC
jgi:hypothetical protein